ncbi:MAG: RecX family transcriptional regulator, partial [Caldilinea sp.]
MAGVITALKVQKNNPERVSVFIDNAFAFGVTLDVATRLHKGQQLNDAEIADLRTNDEIDKAYQAALHFLAARPRSRAEVARRLTEKGHAAEAIEAVLERLEARSYVDDAAFAAFWVENRSRFRPRSAAAIAYELRQKGVEGEAIRAALTEIDEERAAWAAIERQLDRWRALTKAEFEQKIIIHLARRGFGFEIAHKVAQHAWEERQS